ncbi:unnamed protein product, partial [Prorocentrum cordatum]
DASSRAAKIRSGGSSDVIMSEKKEGSEREVRQRTGNTTPTADEEIFTSFLRDFLGFKALARPSIAAKNIVNLLKSNSAATEFGSMIQVYMDQKVPVTQEMRETRNFPKHPLDMSKDTYNKLKEDFTWKWTLTFSDFAPEVFRLALSNLLFWKDPAKAVVIERARSFQTPDGQRSWAALKEKPKPKGGGKKRK